MFIWLLFAGLLSMYLISALTQLGGGSLLFRFTCSVVLRGGRGAADKSHWRVWGALAVFGPHWVCPRSRVCAFLSTLLRLPAALYGAGPVLHAVQFSGIPQKHRLVGPEFCAFPGRSSLGSQKLEGRTLPGCGVPYPLCGPSLSFCAR